MTSYTFRKDLRRSLLEKEFADDFSLSPKIARESRDFGPKTTGMNNRVTHKREMSTARHESLQQARVMTASLDPELLLAKEFEKAHNEVIDSEYEALMERYRRGDHIMRNVAKEQMQDAELEGKMYFDAAETVKNSQSMKTYETMRVGNVVLPPVSKAHKMTLKKRKRYVEQMSDRLSLYQKCLDTKLRVQELNESINDQEAAIGAYSVEIERSRKDDNFDWLLMMHNKIRALQAQVAVEKEDLEHAEAQLKHSQEVMARKYPDMSAAMSLGILDRQQPHCTLGSTSFDDSVDITAMNETRINMAGEEISMVYGWILGRLSAEGNITHLLFGQFTQSSSPPDNGWTYIGKRIILDDYMQAARDGSADAGDDMDYYQREEHGNEMTDKTLVRAKNDTLTTSMSDAIVIMTLKGQKVQTTVQKVTVTGCSLGEVNGRYLENGRACHARKFSNVNGWTIFRHSLEEIPELDILANNCYAPLVQEGTGETISERMYKRTGGVVDELIQPDSGVEDGSAGFKRRFAELSRTGNRMVTVDHQLDLIRCENLKANARVKSDEEMMLTVSMAAAETRRIATGVSENTDTGDAIETELEGNETGTKTPTAATDTSPFLESFDFAKPGDAAVTFRSEASPSPGPKCTSNAKIKSLPLTRTPSAESNAASSGRRTRRLKSGAVTTGKPVDSYDNLDFKVLVGKNVQHQIGSQGYLHIHNKTVGATAEEADVTIQTLARIEQREEILKQLKIEAAEVEKRYVKAEELSNVVDNEKSLARLVDLFEELRGATIDVAESIGAWARVTAKLEEKEKLAKNYLAAKDSSKAARKYSVAISKKGAQLYPPSKPLVESNNRLIRRGLEPAATAVEIQYVGVYDDKDTAIKAFYDAATALPLEQRYAPYVDSAPKMFIGLRACGNHYLIRTLGVPPDYPCEQCQSEKAGSVKTFIPRVAKKLFPQFIWHGENYLDKMWTDSHFLKNVTLLKKMSKDFECALNPLFLTKDRMTSLLNSVVRNKEGKSGERNFGMASDVDLTLLNDLKARMELTQLAVADARKLGMKEKEFTFDGIAYRMAGTRPNLDADYFGPPAKRKIVGLGPLGNTVESSNMQESMELSTKYAADDMSVGTGVSTFSAITFNSKATAMSTRACKKTETVEPPLHMPPLIPDSSALMSTYGYTSDASRNQKSGILSTIEFGTDSFPEERLQRAMIVLGQSLSLKQDFLKAHKSRDDSLLPSTRAGIETGRTALDTAPSTRTSQTAKPLFSKTTNAIKGGGGKPRRLPVDTVSSYTYKGATLSTVQKRAPIAHRVRNKWCRSDIGEWAGLQTKGRAMKKFESEERFENEARRKADERADLQKKLRAAISVDYVSCDVPYIKELLIKSNKFRGSVLDLDIIRAEQYLENRKKAIVCAIDVQRVGRGHIVRRFLWEATRAKREAHAKRMCTEEQSVILVKSLVPSIISTGLSNQVKHQGRPQFKVSANLGGIPMVVSIFARARGLRKSLNLCRSCRAECIVRKYNNYTHTYYNDRAPCTCILVQGPESWLVECYDPITSTRFSKVLTSEEFRRYIEVAYTETRKRSIDHVNALFGESFGAIKPLIEVNPLRDNISRALLEASAEFSILGRFRRSYSDNLLHGMLYKTLPPSLASAFDPHRLPTVKNPITIQSSALADTFVPNDGPGILAWEPLKDYIWSRYQKQVIQLVLPVMTEYAYITQKAYEEKQYEVYLHRTIDLEQANMIYEDVRSLYVTTAMKYDAASRTVKEVMKFSKSSLEKFEAEERCEQEDWSQAWEAKEDANRWYGLNNVRKLRVVLKQHQEMFDNTVKDTQQVIDNHTELLREEQVCKRMADNDSSVIENFAKFITEIEAVTREIQDMTREVILSVVSGMSIPSSTALTSSRRVRFLNPKLAYIRDPVKRIQLKYRALWNVVYRKLFVMRPQVGFRDAPNAKCRSIVTVYRDPTTNNFILQVAADQDITIGAEENMMHTDFNHSLDTFSPLIKYSESNEIAVSPKDIELLFEKSHQWPAGRPLNPLVGGNSKVELSDVMSLPTFNVTTDKSLVSEGSLDSVARSKSMGSLPRLHFAPVQISSSQVISARADLPHISPRPRDDCTSVTSRGSTEIPLTGNLPSVSVLSYSSENRSRCTPSLGYFGRRELKKNEQKSLVERIVKYLRLHPHSQRPCLGLLHFKRRVSHFSRLVGSSLWLHDIEKSMPSSWVNEFCNHKMAVVSKRLLVAKMCDRWGDIVVKLRTPHRGKKYGGFEAEVVIPFTSIVKNMARSPIMLASLLCETITNRYSLDTVSHILRNIDLSLPGECDKWWRKSYVMENTPRIGFVENRDDLYRGPVYSSHRFVSSKYCFAQVFLSSYGDMKIHLQPPTNGLFYLQSLRPGFDVTAQISCDAIKAYLLKKMASESNIQAREMWIALFHPLNLCDLITTILDNIVVCNQVVLKNYKSFDTLDAEECDDDTSCASSSPSIVGRELMRLNTRGTVSSLVDDDNSVDIDCSDARHRMTNMTWRERLKVELWKTVKKFNKWIEIRGYRISPIDNSTLALAYTALRDLEVPPNWKLADNEAEKVSGSKSIFVYDGLWPARDPRRVVRKAIMIDDEYSQEASVSVDDVSVHSHGSDVSVMQESVFYEDSYWRVVVTTDEDKSVVDVNLHETSFTDPYAQTQVADIETRAMMTEDRNSRNAALLELEMAMLRDAAVIRHNAPTIPPKYISMIALAREQNEELKTRMRMTQTKILVAIDAFLDKAALCAFKISVDSLELKESDGRMKFIVDSSSAADMCGSRKSRKQPLSVFVNNWKPTCEIVTADSYSSDARAGKSNTIASSTEQWLKKIEDELFHADSFDVPSVLYQVSNVKVRAYPGISTTTPHGFDEEKHTSSLTVSKVREMKDCSENKSFFRDTQSWARIRPLRAWEMGPMEEVYPHFLQRAQRGTKPRAIRFEGHIFMASAPNVGPFDFSSLNLYNPNTRERFVVCFESHLKLPPIGGLGEKHMLVSASSSQQKLPSKPHDDEGVNGGGSDANDSDIEDPEDQLDTPEDEFQFRPRWDDPADVVLAKTCARRVVWRSLIHGITNAVVKSSEVLIDNAQVELEYQIAYECKQFFTNVLYMPEESKRREAKVKEQSQEGLPAALQSRLSLYKQFAPGTLHRNLSSMRMSTLSSTDETCLANVNLYAVYVPVDEDEQPTVFDSTASFAWQEQCFKKLGCDFSNPPIRISTFPALIYVAPSSAKEYFASGSELKDDAHHNLKLSGWIFEYIANVGWKKGLDFIRHKRKLSKERMKEGFSESPHIIGDCVVIFRFGEPDMKCFMEWCQRRYELRCELIESRRRREIAEHEMRLSNFAEWRRDVFSLAGKFWAPFSELFTEKSFPCSFVWPSYEYSNVIANIDPISGSHIRALLLKFSDLRDKYFHHTCACMRLLDEQYVFAAESRYMIYKNYSKSAFMSAEEYLKFEWDTLDDPGNIQPQPCHILYAIYTVHCSGCSYASSYCPIPGCGTVKSIANSINSDSHNISDYSQSRLKGSGKHPLELAVKKYLLEMSNFATTVVPCTVFRPRPVGSDTMSESGSTDHSNHDELALQSTLDWRKIEDEGRNFRYINRRVVHPSVTSYISAEEVLEAKGGHDDREESDIPYEVSSGLTFYLPPIGGVATDALASYSFHEDDASTVQDSISNLVSCASVKIPTELVRKMLGVVQVAGQLVYPKGVRQEMHDPCPTRKSQQSDEICDSMLPQNSMSGVMYQWLVGRLNIVRPTNNVNASISLAAGSDGAHPHSSVQLDEECNMLPSVSPENDDISLHFDRLQREVIISLRDGTTVVLQILQGVLSGYRRSCSAFSGCPDAARRYLPQNQLLSDLENGITVRVHDLVSDSSQVIFLEGRRLLLFAKTYDIPVEDFPGLANCIVKHAKELLTVQRLDGKCIQATLGISARTSYHAPPVGIKHPCDHKHVSKRYSRLSKNGNRVVAAKALLHTLSCDLDFEECASDGIC